MDKNATPRTDEVTFRNAFGDEYVDADFARQLERELQISENQHRAIYEAESEALIAPHRMAAEEWEKAYNLANDAVISGLAKIAAFEKQLHARREQNPVPFLPGM